MSKLFLYIIAIAFNFNAYASSFTSRADLQKILKLTHKPLKYDDAKIILFTKLDNHQGQVCSIYDVSDCMITYVVPNAKIMNVEHTWPQSKGAVGDAKSDLHHLFISDSRLNSIRSSLPYCEVIKAAWEEHDVKRGYNKFADHCFEPPKSKRGDIARALFYFSVRYGYSIDEHEEFYLRKWHIEDPVDGNEIQRNNDIEKFQGNRNPFVDNAKYVDQIKDF